VAVNWGGSFDPSFWLCGVCKGFLALSILRGLGAVDHNHDLGIQMALVEPFQMILEGKEKLGIGNLGPFFIHSTKKI
jgi:hypothetical protein